MSATRIRNRKPGESGPRAVVTKLPSRGQATDHAKLKGVAALLGSLLLLVGVPIALVMLVGNPLPSEAPSVAWLTADVNAELVINVLAVLVWIVWAHFVVCFLSEWRAVRAGRMPDHVVMGGGPQVLARQLIAGVLLLAGGASIAGGLSSAAAAESVAQHRTSISASVVAQAAEAGAQAGAVEETRADKAAQLKMTTVKTPEGRHHDTLWGIADRTLGDPFRYKEIFELNKGKLMPDGSRLTDADFIKPGWPLLLPADAAGADVVPAGVAADGAAVPGGGAGGGVDVGAATASAVADVVEAGSAGGAGGAGGSGAADHAGLGSILLGGGLVLAGVVTALTARRGAFGSPDDAEGGLRLAASPERADLLDRALRALSESRTAQGLALPDLSVVYLSDDQVVAHLVGEAAAPELPWVAAEDGRSWSVTAEALDGLVPTAPAPYPALVNIATTHGFDVLVDLEYAGGLVALGGESEIARSVAMSIAVDLVTHAWSDTVKVSLVGFAGDIEDISPQRLRVLASVDEALRELEQVAGASSRLLTSMGADGVLAGRALGRNAALGAHVLVLSAPPSPDEQARIRALTTGARTPISVVCVGDTAGARWRFGVDKAGSIELGVLGVSGAARRLDHTAVTELHDLLVRVGKEAAERRAEVVSSPLGDLAPAAPAALARPSRDAATARVRLLGPVEVTAPGPVDDRRRRVLTELVVMAAVHPEGLHEASLQAALWPRGVGDDVVAETVAAAQAWLGSDAEGRPRLELVEGRYQLRDVYVDADELTAAAREGSTAAMVRGLELAQGEAFSGVPTGRYGWLAFHRAARDVRSIATGMASRAGTALADKGDAQGAERVLRLGLDLVPAAEVLWRQLLTLVGPRRPDGSADIVAEMRGRLPGHQFEPETDALAAHVAPDAPSVAGS